MLETPELKEEVQRYGQLVLRAIRGAGFTFREVERQLGYGRNSFRRAFNGKADLKLKHILAVLKVIGVSQGEFFSLAARRMSTRGFYGAFRGAGFRGSFVPLDDELEVPTEEDFDRAVEEALQRTLDRRAREGKPAEAPAPHPEGRGRTEPQD